MASLGSLVALQDPSTGHSLDGGTHRLTVHHSMLTDTPQSDLPSKSRTSKWNVLVCDSKGRCLGFQWHPVWHLSILVLWLRITRHHRDAFARLRPAAVSRRGWRPVRVTVTDTAQNCAERWDSFSHTAVSLHVPKIPCKVYRCVFISATGLYKGRSVFRKAVQK